jgi:hypothetical protein
MLDFQKKLLNRFLVAAAIAKADGFEATAAAILAVAEDMKHDIAARSVDANNRAFNTSGDKSEAHFQQRATR